MIKRIVSIVLASILYQTVWSQGCYPDGLFFTTQSQVDSFPINNPSCTVIEGPLYLYGSDITHIDSLYSITEIDGDLRFTNTQLVNLSGLRESYDNRSIFVYWRWLCF